jgi:hypoxanthine-guanine phosphoribosyltransferase
MTIGDEWVVGYGMDDENGHCRNYKNIYKVW